MIALLILLGLCFPAVDILVAVLAIGLVIKLFKWVFARKKG